MISFNSTTEFILDNEQNISNWISNTITTENFKEGDINYIFCDDKYLLEINQKYLNHDTLTDIISFDYSVGKILHGDIFISIPRVVENASKYKVSLTQELLRVIIHGILHYCGYKDKEENDKDIMRSKEDFYIAQYSSNQ